MADAGDLKSPVRKGRVGSTPTSATFQNQRLNIKMQTGGFASGDAFLCRIRRLCGNDMFDIWLKFYISANLNGDI